MATLLKSDPDLRLQVNGHTDNVGTAERNQALSTQRAETVVEILRGHGVEPGRLEPNGLGDSQPLADNATAQGRTRTDGWSWSSSDARARRSAGGTGRRELQPSTLLQFPQ